MPKMGKPSSSLVSQLRQSQAPLPLIYSDVRVNEDLEYHFGEVRFPQ